MKEKLKVGRFYNIDGGFYELVQVINYEDIQYYHLHFYDIVKNRNVHGRLTYNEMQQEFDILPPVMVELYVD